VTLKTIFRVNPDPDVDTDNYDGPDNMTLSPTAVSSSGTRPFT
jgi:hypothetical protein